MGDKSVPVNSDIVVERRHWPDSMQIYPIRER